MLKQLILKVVYGSFRKKFRKNLVFCVLISAFSLSVSAGDDASQIGRYQIEFGPHARADMFLLDTVTGRTWERIRYTNLKEEPTVWVEADRIDLDSIYRGTSGVIEKYGKKNEKAPDEWVRAKKDDNKK